MYKQKLSSILMESMRNIFKYRKGLQEELYKSVEAKNLTPEELRASKLSNYHCLESIVVEFMSEICKRYSVIHVYSDPEGGPYILLCGLDKDEVDFKYVEGIVKRKTGGKPEEHIIKRGIDICNVLDLRKRPTPVRVARFVKGYRKHFRDVNISSAHFTNVPKSTCESSGLPLEKLVFNQD